MWLYVKVLLPNQEWCVFPVFKGLQKESAFMRKEWHRKQGMGSFSMKKICHEWSSDAVRYSIYRTMSEIIANIIDHWNNPTVLFFVGPHFVEYLSYEVTPECCVILKCKVRRPRHRVRGNSWIMDVSIRKILLRSAHTPHTHLTPHTPLQMTCYPPVCSKEVDLNIISVYLYFYPSVAVTLCRLGT